MLVQAACVTVIADRESDIYEEWVQVPEPGFHLLTRAMHDRRTAEGTLSSAKLTPTAATTITVRARPGRPERQARLVARYGPVRIRRPSHGGLKHLPAHVDLSLVEVVEINPPAGAEPILWRLLTTHPVDDEASG